VFIDDLLDYGSADWALDQDMTGIPMLWVGR
jgi:hypothetical protein